MEIIKEKGKYRECNFCTRKPTSKTDWKDGKVKPVKSKPTMITFRKSSNGIALTATICPSCLAELTTWAIGNDMVKFDVNLKLGISERLQTLPGK